MFGFLDGRPGRGGGDPWSGRDGDDESSRGLGGPILALLVWGLVVLVFALTFVLPQVVTRRSYPAREVPSDPEADGDQAVDARDSRDGGQGR